MSRAFVKEPDGEPERVEVPERRHSPHPNYVTPTGLLQLRERVRRLAALCDELIASGDKADPKRLQYAARDLDYYGERLRRALPVEPDNLPLDEVRFGSTVTVGLPDGERRVFAIVGEVEADVALGKISWVSPLARALLHGRVGDTVLWQRPAGGIELEILELSSP